MKETRGRKPKKTFKIAPGELKRFSPDEEQRLRYRAYKDGWKIAIRKLNGKILVFREM